MRYCCAFVIVVCAMPHPAIAQIRFEEIARKAALDFRLGRFHQVELMPGGVAAFDFNNDGCMDVFFTNGATIPGVRKSGLEFSNRLYRNNCDGTFTDVTARTTRTWEFWFILNGTGRSGTKSGKEFLIAERKAADVVFRDPG